MRHPMYEQVRPIFLAMLLIVIIIYSIYEQQIKNSIITDLMNNPRIEYVDRIVYLPDLTVPQLLPIILARQPRLDPMVALIIANHVIEAGERKRVSALVILAIIEVESNYNQMAVSKKGAIGLMQIMESWIGSKEAKDLGITDKMHLYQIKPNIELGTAILCKLCRDYKTTKDALAYYFGSKEVDRYYDTVMKTVGEMVMTMSFGKP